MLATIVGTLTEIPAKLYAILLTVLGLLTVVGLAFAYIVRSEKAKNALGNAKDTINDLKLEADATGEVARMSDDAVLESLRHRWSN